MKLISVLGHFVMRRFLGSKKACLAINVFAIPMWVFWLVNAPNWWHRVALVLLVAFEVFDLVQNVRWVARGLR